ncbi:MAG: acyl-CoA synthetase [Actinomycetota bacterium]|nr:acyl-CoA synthetase [Actinomycetota bacterium]
MDFNLADIFESVVDAVADRTALVVGDRSLTYSEIDARSNRIAHHLLASGVKAGNHVGMYLYNGFPYVEGLLACLKIRAIPINVNYRYVEGELKYIFDEADLVALFHQREFSQRVVAVRSPKMHTLVVVDDESDVPFEGSVEYEEALNAGSPDRDFAPRSQDDLFIIFTGGTTGMPKGVMWRHEDLFFAALGGGNPTMDPISKPEEQAEIARQRYALSQFPVPPLIHGAAQLAVLIGFNWGDTVTLIPRFDAHAAWRAVEDNKVNTMTIVGDAMARPLADALEEKQYDTSTLMYFGSTGAVLSEAVKEQLRTLLPNSIIAENFGATETGFQGGEAFGAGSRHYMMNERTAVLDEDLKPVVPGSGAVGRLALKRYIPLGYYKDPEKTAATFVEVNGERWVIPGDMAVVEADGIVTVLGRGSVCINSGGEKIYPEEVESAVKGHPDVYDVVIVGVPDDRWGERVAAVVQPRPGKSPTLEAIQDFCSPLIARYKVPREIHLVDQVQRQPSGKPDYPWAKAVATSA